MLLRHATGHHDSGDGISVQGVCVKWESVRNFIYIARGRDTKKHVLTTLCKEHSTYVHNWLREQPGLFRSMQNRFHTSINISYTKKEERGLDCFKNLSAFSLLFWTLFKLLALIVIALKGIIASSWRRLCRRRRAAFVASERLLRRRGGARRGVVVFFVRLCNRQ